MDNLTISPFMSLIYLFKMVKFSSSQTVSSFTRGYIWLDTFESKPWHPWYPRYPNIAG